MNTLVIALIVGTVSFVAGVLVQALLSSYTAQGARRQAKNLLKEARREAKSTRKESEIQGKADVLNAREEFEHSIQDRRRELEEMDERIHQRETNLDRKVALIDNKERLIEEKLQALDDRREQLDTRAQELETMKDEYHQRLQKAAHLTCEQAKEELLTRLGSQLRPEMDAIVRERYRQTVETAEAQAQKIVTTAIQRYVASHVNEIMSSSVALPTDEMKGRIIGRNGRNIRSLEAETGATILVDDTPEAVVISAFDPVRREVARQALERLIADGRIHPGRIEEIVREVRAEMDDLIQKSGEDAACAAGVTGVDPGLLRILGGLKFRSSFAQNVLDHSVEVSHLMATMSAELGLDPLIARRVGLFHDIGKAVSHEADGPHAVVGGDLLSRHGETEVVANAVAAHHDEVESQSLYSVLAATADAISSARPGARTETTETYLKRLEKLEALATSFDGVDTCYAIHAGREIRVIVKPSELDDDASMLLARDLSNKIQANLDYPGQIRVTVIRETRCVQYAK